MHALFKANQTLHLLLSLKIASRHSPTLTVIVVWAEHHEPVKLFAIYSAPPLDPWRGVQDIYVRRKDPSSWLIAVSPEKSNQVHESFAREHAYVANKNNRFRYDRNVGYEGYLGCLVARYVCAWGLGPARPEFVTLSPPSNMAMSALSTSHPARSLCDSYSIYKFE